MRQFGILPTEFWRDPKIRSLEPRTRLVAVYLYAGPHTNAIGCFRLPLSYIEEDLAIQRRFVQKAVKELVDISFLRFDDDSRYFVLNNFLQSRAQNWLKNPNNFKSALRELNEIPESIPFREEISLQLAAFKGEGSNGDTNDDLTPSGCRTHNGKEDGKEDGNGNEKGDEKEDAPCAAASPSDPFSFDPFNPSLPSSLSFPLKDGGELELDRDEMNGWQVHFRHIVVPIRLKHHLEWFQKNPNKRMNAANTKKKLFDWLATDNREAELRSRSGAKGGF